MQKKSNYYSDNSDLEFQFEKRVDWDTLFLLTSDNDKETMHVSSATEYKELFVDLMKQIGEVAGTSIAANQIKVSKQDLLLKSGEVEIPPAMAENIKILMDLGVSTIGISGRYDGLPSPVAVELPLVEMLYRACPSTYLNVTWFSPIARMIDAFGSEDQKKRVIPRLASGEWSGNMALTEPDTGSDLGAIKTFGELQSDGYWKLFGTKRFITNGNGQVSLVLGKGKKGATGLHALNLYLCFRKNENGQHNYEITKLEEKTGLHGSATCELKFEGSSAELIGEEGHGFQYMLHLMNEARVAVAFQGIGVMEEVLRLTKSYTELRKTWGRPIAQHEMIVEKLLDMEVALKAARSISFQAGNANSICELATKKLNDDKSLTEEQRAHIKDLQTTNLRRVRRLTPLVKYFAGEQAVMNARMCLQLHGGYGFTTEYLAEWWLRESLIIPVYEGTTQIQALMCLKDTLKDVIRRPTLFIESALGLHLAKISERDHLRRKLARLKQEFNGALVSIIVQLVKVNVRSNMINISPLRFRKMIRTISKDLVKFENLRPALLNAERITEMKIAVCVAQSLMADVKVDSTRNWLAERWLNKALPRVIMLRAEIEMQEPVLSHRLAEIPVGEMR
jgi:alkylation response protein AidB-like acyl-CoA dehydrogenase